MFVDRQPVARALDRLAVPTLLLSGDDDPLVDRPTLLEHARRPGWEFHVFDGAGHLLPIAFPRVYADVVAGWLQRSAWRSQESVDPACNAGDP
jgi:pimeloyl-ACP methyl ester carboxylesterase